MGPNGLRDHPDRLRDPLGRMQAWESMCLWFYAFMVLWFYDCMVLWFQEITKFPFRVFRKISADLS